MIDANDKQTFIFRSFVNSFYYLYQDAEFFRKIASKPELADTFETVRLCRTALLLYIFSLEGLINRALEHFLPEHLRDFFLKREEQFRLEDKWRLLPILVSQKQPAQFDESRYPWSHFVELIHIRNDFVHPKHDRPAYYRAISVRQWRGLAWNEIPDDSGIKETDVIYRQSRIPKDPYGLRLNHVEQVKKIVDDTIAELDRLLGGCITQNNWLRNDDMKLIYPPGAKLDDLPPEANPQVAG